MKRTSYRIVEGPYLRDLLDQPQALQDTLKDLRCKADLFDRLAQIRHQGHARVVLTGMGSSLHALYPLELMLTAQGEPVKRGDSSELIHSMPSLLAGSTIIVAVSQSGRSAEVVRMLEQSSGRATVIGVTNTADSPLARQANFLILTQCGEEFSVSAKTYVGTLAALEILVFNTAVANLVREGKTHQIPGMIQVGKKYGNTPLDDSIMDHLKLKRISPDEAYDKCIDKKKFRPFLAHPPEEDEM